MWCATGAVARIYIYSNDHDIEKLGISKDTKKFMLALLIGIIGGLGLLLINFFTTFMKKPFRILTQAMPLG